MTASAPAADTPVPPTYFHDIPSLQTTHPFLPATIGASVLNVDINTGTLIKRQDLIDAKEVCDTLLAQLGEHPAVTVAVVLTAEMRKNKIENIHSIALDLPESIARLSQAIQDQNDLVLQRLDISDARAHNVNIREQNLRLGELAPVQKTVPGGGHELVHLIFINKLNRVPQTLRTAPADYNPAAIGSVPPNFQALVHGYSHHEIARMIVHYNEDFGILPCDSLAVYRMKFINFLRHLLL